MRRYLILLLGLLILVGCMAGGSAPAQTPGNAAPAAPAVRSAPQDIAPPATESPADLQTGATPEVLPAATEAPGGTGVAAAAQGWTQSSGALTVELLAAPELTVSDPRFRVHGSAPAGTVVSVNDDILLVDASGEFEAWVDLDEGPNWVEVVASNAGGDEVSYMMTVTRESQP